MNSAARILIVDDEPNNVLLLTRILERAGYAHLKSTTDPREVVTLFAAFDPDILLVDLHMPHLTGFEVMNEVALHLGVDAFVPTVMLTADVTREAREKALTLGANDFVTKPFDAAEVVLRVGNLLRTRALHVRLHQHNVLLAETAERDRATMERARIEVLQRLAMTAELRDNETHEHTQRVGDLAAELAAAIGMSESEQHIVRLAAPLHDIGKIGILDAVLRKPGKLTSDEIDHMRTHTTIGAHLLSGSPIVVLQAAEVIAITHHERWDGTGYPNRLRGLDIPLPGRIVAVADVFDALTNSRPYKPAWSHDRAMSHIAGQRSHHFDPDMVDAFLMVMEKATTRV